MLMRNKRVGGGDLELLLRDVIMLRESYWSMKYASHISKINYKEKYLIPLFKMLNFF